jgi:hypothetical protein
MQRRGSQGLIVAILGLGLLFLATVPAAALDKKQVVTQARAAYYNLKAQGLTDFRCNAMPNWAKMLEEVRQKDPAQFAKAIDILKQLSFDVAVNTNGKTQVTHNTPAAGNADVAAGFADIYKGMEQMMSGFFDTWSPFAFNGILPEPGGEYQLTDAGTQYRLMYKDGSADVETTMGRDFAISEVKVKTATFRSSLRPQLSKGAEGFVLTGYTADYEGQTKEEATHLEVSINYQQVSGVKLPQTLNLKGSYGASPFQVELGFSGCQANKH